MKYRYATPIVIAQCFTCGKVWQTANAHGVAAKHAQKHKHKVVVEKVYYLSYDGTENAEEG